ncbi:MAG: 16S rRNA (cytidine(1402)-2'-O)-methyltransferase [Syntrophus sp. (in: bacteria)]|nr:16S rRNA (cytidine(1402)-2'-O)-methyltransferase [Syntrophus sp. (in: bacteria)]
MDGIMYIVATPIGNLKDITLRAIEVLKDVDIVIAEDRSRALKLLSHLDIRKPIISINSYNEERKAPEIVARLMNGKSCALITGAGTPCISDPGRAVANHCHEAGLEVRAVPGPSAAMGALSISGLYTDRFLFYGFLPLKKGKKKKIIRDLALLPYPVIFFESPRRLMETLCIAKEEFGDREAAVFKEMTKVHEKVWRGTLTNLIEELEEVEPKGEYTIIVSGTGK